MPLVESVLVEIVPFCNKKYILVGYIYKHPGANMDEFKGKFNETTLISINYICIFGDMNTDIFKYGSHPPKGAYLDIL